METVKDDALEIQPATPMQMLAMAVSQNADLDKLTKLMDLQERWEKNEARKAFVTAMNAFKANPPTIRKNKHVHFDTQKGPTDYDHATLDHVCEQVTIGLSKHGISHRWKVEQGDQIKVTCILTHDKGHSEETTIIGPADTSGNKNPIQAVGSSVTYLQRYTLLSATGLAAVNQDDDGHGGVTNGAVAEKVDWIKSCSTLEELQRIYKDAYKEFEASPNAIRALIAAKDARKKELA